MAQVADPVSESSSRDAAQKAFVGGTERTLRPEESLRRALAAAERCEITRAANVTGLDRVGIPVFAVYRPNARSLSVAQGKGLTPLEAKVSGLMEAIETHHAEHITLPLRLASFDELRRTSRVADVGGLPRLQNSTFQPASRLLWVGGSEMLGGVRCFVPFEAVHTDFRMPLPEGSGAFLMSSNGLASGNHVLEAISHAICELVERDAQTLWQLSGEARRRSSKVKLDTIDDERCRRVLDLFDVADIEVCCWETTSDIGLPAFCCTVVDRDKRLTRPMPPAHGAGCHVRRGVALLRALTEAAQSRLTVIAGARDDENATNYDLASAVERAENFRAREADSKASASFRTAPDFAHDTVDADVTLQLQRLAAVGLQQVVCVDLTDPELRIPVVRLVIPHLEPLNDIRGYVPGRRAHRCLGEASS
jgi:ribosomal protein S12 methylthiotransferase accessory factor